MWLCILARLMWGGSIVVIYQRRCIEIAECFCNHLWIGYMNVFVVGIWDLSGWRSGRGNSAFNQFWQCCVWFRLVYSKQLPILYFWSFIYADRSMRCQLPSALLTWGKMIPSWSFEIEWLNRSSQLNKTASSLVAGIHSGGAMRINS